MATKNPKDIIASENPKLVSLRDEATLLLDKHVLSDPDGDDEIIIAQAYIRINQKKIDSMIPVQIVPEQLDELFNKSTYLRDKNTDVLGLKILYGSQDDKIIYLYQPIALILKYEANDTYMQPQGVFEVKEDKIYEYVNDEFKTPFTTDHRTLYHSKAEVVHIKKDGFKGIKQGTDVTAAIFTFQEIFALLYDNEPREHLNIFTSIKRTTHEEKPYMLHSIVLASHMNKPNPKDAFRPFTGAYANLAHLCPPNCSNLIYPLEK